MKDRLKQRLAELKAEYESGQKALTAIELRKSELTDTLLRISGAILVIEEMLAPEDEETADCTPGVQPVDEQEIALHPE